MSNIKDAVYYLNKHGCQYSFSQEENIESAMKEYAEQFINAISDELEVIEYTELNGDTFHVIDERSIESLRKQIK